MKKTKTYRIMLYTALILHSIWIFPAAAQPIIQWQKCLGGTKADYGNSIKATFDGGYISIGQSFSNDGDVTTHHGSIDTADIWVVKTDAIGTLQWQKSYGGSASDGSVSIIQTTDSGYIFVGSTFSTDGDITVSKGASDVWVVKLDATGNIEWQKSFGGTLNDNGVTIIQTIDGGFMVGAVTSSNNGDVSGNHGWSDLWLLKIDVTGNIQWQKCLGGTSFEGSQQSGNVIWGSGAKVSVIQTSDSGFFVAGPSCSNDGDLTSHHGSTASGYTDYWIVKLNNVGIIQWQQSFGGTQQDNVSNAIQTTDGGYIISGSTLSKDGDVVGQHINNSGGNASDMWIVKVNATGTLEWTKALGGTFTDHGTYISETSDGGYFVSGYTNSRNGDVAGLHSGFTDAWILKLNATGALLWQKCLGGFGTDGLAGFQTADGGYILIGATSSNNDDVSGNHGWVPSTTSGIYIDVWMVKLSAVSDNVIRGNVYEDVNANCLKDSTEIYLKGRIVKAMPGNYFASTDVLGNYSLFVDSGAYTVSHIPPAYYNQSCPAAAGTYTVAINSVTPNSFNNDFADTLTSHCADLKLSIATSYLRKCRKNSYVIRYENSGAVAAANVMINVTFPALIIPFSSSIPWTAPFQFNLNTLQPGQIGFLSITDSLSCNANLGDTLCASVSIVTTSSECNVVNNSASDCHVVIASCDPNGIEVQSQSSSKIYVTQENITDSDSLTYLIHFQNIGNDTAFTVIVRDTLSNYIDPASIQSMAASHTFSFRIYGKGVCEWTFNNILLPDSNTNELLSQGFVKFTVLQNQVNSIGTVISNKAAIWFDYNEYLLTNITSNSIVNPLAFKKISSQNYLNVFPNPFKEATTITMHQELEDAELLIYSVLGQEMGRMKKISGNEIKVNRNNLASGVYSFKIIQNQTIISNGKLIIE
jgi:uncharacterized repeat protein (TIGR01451 family)